MAQLEIKDITSGYGEVQVLWGSTLCLEKQKLTCLVGGNGAGKTTLMRTIIGLLPPWGGTVTFDGKDISKLPAYAKAEMGLVLVPEGRQLFTDMTIYENLEMGASNQRARPKFAQNLERVYEMFPRLKERSSQKAGTLSGGEQQMLAVARALMSAPRILLVDEPSVGLAPMLVSRVIAAIRQLKERHRLTVLMAEQNFNQAIKIADRGYIIVHGEIAFEGKDAEALRDNEMVRQYYLGV